MHVFNMQTSKLKAALAVALELPESDRRELAHLIYASLPKHADDRDYSAADLTEWNRRVETIESGRARTFSADEVSNEARELLG
jgi:putative addiction module component (TIGR02574 family)